MRNKRFPVFGNLRGLCFAGILTAMSIVLGKFLQIPNPFQEFIRISFENLPILIAGISLGPIAGAIVGIAADLIGCVLYGYSINPIITAGAMAIGLISGIISRYVIKKPESLKIIISSALAHIIGSVLIKSYGLSVWYLSKYELGFWEFVAWRFLNYAIVATAECVIIILMFKNLAFKKYLQGMSKNK